VSQDTALKDQLEIQALILRSASLLDVENLPEWQSLFDPAGVYEITAYSTELGKKLSWWKTNMTEMAKLLSEVSEHVRDPARRLRTVSPGPATVTGDTASANSAFAVFRTLPTGESSLYVVGRYQDQLLRQQSGKWALLKRVVELDTRVLQAFTHLPL
jgi:3-phenylpropionate/cinnamic acid dioxygenase small subunit